MLNAGKVILRISHKKLNWRDVYIARNRNLKTCHPDGNAQSTLEISWWNIAGFRWTWKWFFSESSDSENDILEEDSVVSEGNSTVNEEKLGENRKVLLYYSRRRKWDLIK